jgi:hypothetical protein
MLCGNLYGQDGVLTRDAQAKPTKEMSAIWPTWRENSQFIMQGPKFGFVMTPT